MAEPHCVHVMRQGLVIVNLASTVKYPKMAIAKILKASGERDYVLVRNAEDPSSLLESLGDGRLRGMNVLFISPM